MVLLTLLAAGLVALQTAAPRAPFVATPVDVVDRMLALARISSRDVVYDLGCGDGRIVIAAAREFGARGVGVDIDPVRIEEARENARRAGVEHLVSFRVEDALATDLREATVVTLYMLASINARLRPNLERQLPAGARIVSHDFPVGDWPPEVVDNFVDRGGRARTLYRWTIP